VAVRVWEAQRREAEHRLAYIGLYPYKVRRSEHARVKGRP
jgi:hypothetical protein